MSATKNKDILSLLQSRIALRANFLSEYDSSGATDWPAVEDQKADKKAVAEIVKLRRELKYQCYARNAAWSAFARMSKNHGQILSKVL